MPISVHADVRSKNCILIIFHLMPANLFKYIHHISSQPYPSPRNPPSTTASPIKTFPPHPRFPATTSIIPPSPIKSSRQPPPRGTSPGPIPRRGPRATNPAVPSPSPRLYRWCSRLAPTQRLPPRAPETPPRARSASAAALNLAAARGRGSTNPAELVSALSDAAPSTLSGPLLPTPSAGGDGARVDRRSDARRRATEHGRGGSFCAGPRSATYGARRHYVDYDCDSGVRL